MRILVLHQNLFDRLGYEKVIDHSVHEVTYAGAPEYLANIPEHIRCETYPWDPAQPVVAQLRPLLAARPPYDRVIARHEELITPAAELRAEFGIPGMQPEVACNFRDKVAMKHTLDAAGFRVPKYLSLDSLDHLDAGRVPWRGRTIVKPRDGRGSQGVVLLDSVEAAVDFVRAQEAAAGAAFRDRHELEEYVEGPILHIDGFLFEGEVAVVQASEYVGTTFHFNHGEPLGSFQVDEPDLADWAVGCVRALGGETLTFHLEAIRSAEGPVFLEVAARCGGGNIVRCTELRTGAYLHTLDMASDIEGALATRFIGPARTDLCHGWFLFPGHVYDGARVTVQVPDGVLDEPIVVSHRLRDPNAATPLSHSFRPEHLPLSGVVAAVDPAEVEGWIRRLFAITTVSTRPVGAEAPDGTDRAPAPSR